MVFSEVMLRWRTVIDTNVLLKSITFMTLNQLSTLVQFHFGGGRSAGPAESSAAAESSTLGQ